MEVSNVVPFPLHQPLMDDTTSAMDIDMDMDIDLGIDQDLSNLEAEALKAEISLPTHPLQSTANITTATSPGPTVDLTDPAPTKVHIRGLDNLATADIRAFASEHSQTELVRIEWIDDTSANILYESPEAAAEALANFTENAFEATSVPALQLRKTKPLSSHPSVELHIRLATVGDIKKPRAREASRFYLLNPDKDPQERRRRYRRDPDAQYRRKRRRDGVQTPAFDVSMYDDDAGGSLAVKEPVAVHGRSESFSSYDSSIMANDDQNRTSRRRVRFAPRRETDLFAGRAAAGESRLRDRSASPGRDDGDGRLGFGGDENRTERSRKIRRRSLTPPPPYRSRDPHPYPRDNAGKELFATSSSDNAGKELFCSDSSAHNGSAALGSTQNDLFPNRSSPFRSAVASKDLFPNKTPTSNHRRTDAIDAAADETADLFANGMNVPFTDGTSDTRPRDTPKIKGGDLFSRITNGKRKGDADLFSRINGGSPSSASLPSLSYGRLVDTNGSTNKPADTNIANGATSSNGSHGGFNIRGMAAPTNEKQTSDSDTGFSIRGLSAKELFPTKSSRGEAAGANQGIELFGERIKGRGAGARKRAEDLFF